VNLQVQTRLELFALEEDEIAFTVDVIILATPSLEMRRVSLGVAVTGCGLKFILPVGSRFGVLAPRSVA
jgi:hypothetical protein